MLDLFDNAVNLVKYDKKWVNYYLIEKQRLEKLIGDYILDIDHVGSTSIEGLSAKTIIDIMIVVKNLKKALDFEKILVNNKYFFRNDNGVQQEYFVNKKDINIEHYIHIVEKDSERYNNFIVFKNYLNAHPSELIKYQNLKEHLASMFKNDRKNYTISKGKYIEQVINKAKKEK